MAKLNKKIKTIVVVSMAAVLSAAAIGAVFTPHLKALENDVARAESALREARALVAQKPFLESEWESKKRFFPANLDSDAVLGAWVKDVLSLAQNQALSMEKLEPAGIKTGENEKKWMLLVSFQGDIGQFVRFIDALSEKDALSGIESFRIRREEEPRLLYFEILLGKAIP